jgi:hypothetical protein
MFLRDLVKKIISRTDENSQNIGILLDVKINTTIYCYKL